MAAIAHPDTPLELEHLDHTLGVIAQETALADAALKDDYAKLIEARKYDPDGVPLREMMYARDDMALNNLRLAARKPYFTRVERMGWLGAVVAIPATMVSRMLGGF